MWKVNSANVFDKKTCFQDGFGSNSMVKSLGVIRCARIFCVLERVIWCRLSLIQVLSQTTSATRRTVCSSGRCFFKCFRLHSCGHRKSGKFIEGAVFLLGSSAFYTFLSKMHQLRPGPGNLRPFESKTFDGRMLHKVEENRFSVRFQLQGPQGQHGLRLIPVPSSWFHEAVLYVLGLFWCCH